MHRCIYIYTYIHIDKYIYTHGYIYIHIHIYIHICIYTYIYIYIYTFTRIYIRTDTYIYVYTRVYIGGYQEPPKCRLVDEALPVCSIAPAARPSNLQSRLHSTGRAEHPTTSLPARSAPLQPEAPLTLAHRGSKSLYPRGYPPHVPRLDVRRLQGVVAGPLVSVVLMSPLRARGVE